LSFGLLLADGTCEGLLNALPMSGGIESEECVIRGEAIQASDDHGPWYNINQAPTWAGSEVFENAFCSTSIKMSDYCEEEAEAIDDAGIECDWEDVLNVDAHCFCGDPANNPTG
jgi:hypothetical protein